MERTVMRKLEREENQNAVEPAWGLLDNGVISWTRSQDSKLA